tara:strand:- start:192 stop:1199 length:1008 start_codon:yes stop_codon:yes gene_type:complete
MKKKIIIIAEAGVNHNGNLILAKRLIDVAVNAKADYVKFQLYDTESFVKDNALLAPYQKKNTKFDHSQKTMLKKYELSFEDIKELLIYSKKKKIKFLCTPFDITSIKNLKKLKVNIFKIASPDLDNFPLFYNLRNGVKKIFISTGMSSISDITKTIKFLEKINIKKSKLILLHCVSDYPAKKNDLNLNAIKLIRERFKIKVGFSDHSEGSLASVVATTLGAEVIEKHITLNKKLPGPDHSSSMNEKEFTNFVSLIRDTQIVLGKKSKEITTNEKKNFKMVKRSVFFNNDVKKGSKLKISDFICMRPRKKLKSINWEKIQNKTAKKNYKKGEFIDI